MVIKAGMDVMCSVIAGIFLFIRLPGTAGYLELLTVCRHEERMLNLYCNLLQCNLIFHSSILKRIAGGLETIPADAGRVPGQVGVRHRGNLCRNRQNMKNPANQRTTVRKTE